MNRRNVLIGLGTVAAGGGAVLGTGAFSTVEAQRTVDIQTSGDSEAVVQFSLSGQIAGSDNDTIKFDTKDINADAITKFDGALTITIPGSTRGTTYEVEITDGSEDDNDILKNSSADETDSGSSLQLIGGDNNPLEFNTDGGEDSKTLDVVINTVGTTSADGDNTSIDVNTVDFEVTDTTTY